MTANIPITVTVKPSMSTVAVLSRGGLYVGAACLNDLYAFLTMAVPPPWKVIAVKLAITACITARSFIDQSPTQNQAEQKVIDHATADDLDPTAPKESS